MASTSASLAQRALQLDALVRERAPLVHHITNHVVMNFTANVTLALGAQPVMAHAHQELEEMTGFASALVLNIGTLESAWIDSMLIAGKAASRRATPIVLDPVGAGATRLRTETARRLLDELDVTVLRGNPGEVLAVAGDAGKTRGVDSLAKTTDAIQAARLLAADRKMIVAVTGPIDVITDGTVTYEVANGHPLFGRVTGTGCAATTAIGCFVGVAPPEDRGLAVASALAVYGRAGELAADKSSGPGTFVPALIDALYHVPHAVDASSLRIARKS
jgi:hydroxyethylthiazole kinase